MRMKVIHEIGPGGAMISYLGLAGFAPFRSPIAFTERRPQLSWVPGVRVPETNSSAYAKDTPWHGKML